MNKAQKRDRVAAHRSRDYLCRMLALVWGWDGDRARRELHAYHKTRKGLRTAGQRGDAYHQVHAVVSAPHLNWDHEGGCGFQLDDWSTPTYEVTDPEAFTRWAAARRRDFVARQGAFIDQKAVFLGAKL